MAQPMLRNMQNTLCTCFDSDDDSASAMNPVAGIYNVNAFLPPIVSAICELHSGELMLRQ